MYYENLTAQTYAKNKKTPDKSNSNNNRWFPSFLFVFALSVPKSSFARRLHQLIDRNWYRLFWRLRAKAA